MHCAFRPPLPHHPPAGTDPPQPRELTQSGGELRNRIEAQTDALERPVLVALGYDYDHVIGTLNEWSGQPSYTVDPDTPSGG